MRFQWREGMKGLGIGVLLGAVAGLGVWAWLPWGALLFSGDTVLFGAITCGVGGFLFGDNFFERLEEGWHWFLGG